jgi:hypothetical protein
VVQDSSSFRWLEDRCPACQLIARIVELSPDTTGGIIEDDTRKENLRTLEGWQVQPAACEALLPTHRLSDHL